MRLVVGIVLLVVGVALAANGVYGLLREDLQGGADAWGLIFLVCALVAGLSGGALVTSAKRRR